MWLELLEGKRVEKFRLCKIKRLGVIIILVRLFTTNPNGSYIVLYTYEVRALRRNTYIYFIILWRIVGLRIIVVWRENTNVHSHTCHVILFDSTKFTGTRGRDGVIMVCIVLQYAVSAVLRGVQLTWKADFWVC